MSKKGSKVFKRLTYSPNHLVNLMELLDATYRAQVKEIEKEQLLQRSCEHFGVDKLTDEQIATALRHYSDARLRWCQKVLGRPVILGLGSARDTSVTQYGIESVEAIAKQAVRQNLGICTGKWCRGYMGVYAKSFLAEKQNYQKEWAFSCAVPLLGQESDPAKLVDAPDWYKNLKENAISPPHASFVGRTPDLVLAPQTLVCLYATPGLGTIEEFSRIHLDNQMMDRNLSMFSWRSKDSIPSNLILDEPLGGGWVWDWLPMLAKSQIASQTIHPLDYSNTVILRRGKSKQRNRKSPIKIVYFDSPKSQASYVVEEAWKCHTNLTRHILSTISE